MLPDDDFCNENHNGFLMNWSL